MSCSQLGSVSSCDLRQKEKKKKSCTYIDLQYRHHPDNDGTKYLQRTRLVT